MIVGILVCGLTPLFVLDDDDDSGGGGGDDDVTDPGYYDNETRLMKVSSFFRDQVDISIDSNQFTANATLYLVNETPQLIPGFYIDENIQVDSDITDDYPGVNYDVFYLHPNSTVTLSACIPSDCDPFFLFIMKSQSFNKWKDSPSGADTGEANSFVTKDCSKGFQQLNYTVTEDALYYLITYATTSCIDDIYDKRQATLAINRYEYSVKTSIVTDVCNTYRYPSCSLKIPLGSGHVKALVTVGGHDGGRYDITFTTSSRVWSYCVVIIPIFCLLIVPVICCIWCYVRRKRRNSYSRL